MTLPLTMFAPPLAAIVTGFVLIAIPVVILMTVWTCVTMMRILFPERHLPFDGATWRERPRPQNRAVPVRFRDLVEDQRRAEAPAMPVRTTAEPGATPELPVELADDLWLRRN